MNNSMRHIHIAIVGAQPMPVYIGIKDCKPDYVFLICSSKTRIEAKRVQQEIVCPSEILEFDPVDLQSIAVSVKALKERMLEDIISVNISGGTKPWTYYFITNFGVMSNARIFYVDQNNLIWNFSDQKSSKIDFKINMDVLFRLYGNIPKLFRCLDKYTDEDIKSIDKIKEFRIFNRSDFVLLTNNFDINADFLIQKTKIGSSLEFVKDKFFFIFKLYNRLSQSKMEIFDSPNIKELLLNSGWFEVEVALLLNKWDKTYEMRLNCIFSANDNMPKNEIDIIINTGIKLLFIECKTKIHSTTDIDKFRSAVNNYGGMGSKAFFVTDDPMSQRALEKCVDNNIFPFSIKENGGIKNCKEILFDLLDKEIFKINAR